MPKYLNSKSKKQKITKNNKYLNSKNNSCWLLAQ